MIKGLDEEYNLYYLNNPAAFAVDFFRFKGGPLFLYPYEVEALNLNDRFQAWLFARQTGKTMTLAIKILVTALLQDESNIPITAPRQYHANRIIARMKGLMLRSKYWDNVIKPMTGTYKGNKDLAWSKTQIEFTNGSIVTALPEGTDGTTFLGESTTLGVVDEVAKLKDAETFINGVLRPSVFATRGSLILCSSSWGRYGKGAAWYNIINSPDYKVLNIDAYRALKDQKKYIGKEDYFAKLADLEREKKRDPIMFAMQYMNSFEGGLDAPFDYDLVKAMFTADPYPYYDRLDFRQIMFFVDWGKSTATGDKSVIMIADVTELPYRIVYRQFQKSYTEVTEEIINETFTWNPIGVYPDTGAGANQIEILTNKLTPRNIEVQGTTLTPGLHGREYIDLGYKFLTVPKNTAVEMLAVLMAENGLIIHSQDPLIMKEFWDYTKEITGAGNVKYDHLPSGHDDCIDPLLAMVGKLRLVRIPELGQSQVITRIREKKEEKKLIFKLPFY